MSSKKKLECCLRSPNSTEVMSCYGCKKRYHYNCISTSKTCFNELSENYKTTWLCPTCARPKRDNTNTPIRTSLTTSEDHDNQTCNVTLRIKDNERKVIEKITSDLPLHEVRYIVREEMKSLLGVFKKSILDEFTTKTNEVLASINFLEDQYENIKKDLSARNEVIKTLQLENKTLHSKVNDLQTRLTLVENQSRASNLEIQCIPEHRSENITSTVKQLAANVKYNLSDTDIQSCSRIMKINKESPRPRSVLVKFSSPRVRDNFLAATIAFNKQAKCKEDKLNTSHLGIGGNKQPIYVTEHLPPATKALHAEARIKAKELKYEFVWIKNGRVFMRKSKSSDYKIIKSSESLLNLS
ncbi:uncharacterized protein LOC124534966 [Vanessa cardui]|uniref:uncharacterized protein LOC124534966 n=1 Tax=Vanessa cardui TaxID=171605 RepID=UPI001F1442F5|nr:uncharacterized protein LOC124534966 [Vanessa cardui]